MVWPVTARSRWPVASSPNMRSRAGKQNGFNMPSAVAQTTTQPMVRLPLATAQASASGGSAANACMTARSLRDSTRSATAPPTKSSARPGSIAAAWTSPVTSSLAPSSPTTSQATIAWFMPKAPNHAPALARNQP